MCHRIVYFEGNIGAGKSSVLDRLALKGYPVLKEPVEQWSSASGMLGCFYTDPARYAYHFQEAVMRSLTVRDATVRSVSGTVMSERSAGSGLMVFAEHARQQGWISGNQLSWSEKQHRAIQEAESDISRSVIYIRTDPKNAYSRMKQRGRSEEINVTLEYLTEIHRLHEVQCATQRPFGSVLLGVLDGSKSLDLLVKNVCLAVDEACTH